MPHCSPDHLVEKSSSLDGFLQTNLLESCSTNCSYFFQTHQSFSKWHSDSQPMLLWTPDLLGLSISPCSLPATALGQQQKPSHQLAPWREGSLHAKLQSRTKPWVWKPIRLTTAPVVWTLGHKSIRTQMKESLPIVPIHIQVH